MKKGFPTSVYTSVPGAALTAALGIVLLIWPSMSSTIMCYALSAGVLVYGAYRIFTYFRTPLPDAVKRHDFAAGIMLFAIALFMLANPALIISLLPSLLGLLMVMGAAREAQTTCNFYRMNEARWYMPLIAAGVQAILGLIILWNPFATAMVLMRFIGASVLLESVSQIVFPMVLAHREKAGMQ